MTFSGAVLNSYQRVAGQCTQVHISSLFLEQQAKAQKKEMESKKKYTVEDSVHVTTTSTVQSLAAQAKIYLTSKTPIPNDSSETSVASQRAPKHQNAIGKKVETTNIKAVSRSSLVNTQDAIDSTEPTQRDVKLAESDGPRSQPAGKPLRERQLLPLPHFGAVIPPPAEFAGYSGKGETTLARDSNKG